MIGQIIAHYKIVEKLGEGGMGVVYKAEDTRLHRTVALKFLSSETVATDADRDRFVAEARSAAALDHPNICTIYEINEFEGQSYIAMAYVEGRSLREEIDEVPLDVDRAIALSVQIALGLSAAHEQGIVHRDIKSANIMVSPKGVARIMDFGIAHRAGAIVPDDDVTTAGTLVYSSPEQLRGDAVDHRSDLWSFGVTLYETITGQTPFRGDYPSAMAYTIQSESPRPMRDFNPDVPEALERIVERALAKTPDDRYPSAAEMHDELRALQIERDPNISKVFASVGGAAPDPWYRQLLSGRVLVSAIAYIVFAFAAMQLTGWMVSRFVWSPHLEGIVAVALASLLPAVMLIAASRSGAGGRSAVTARNIGVPLNLVVSLALVFAFYAGKDLGAATTTVSVTDEEGNTVERVVPKAEFRKKTAVFFFDNESGNEDLDWIHYAIPLMLQIDLYQDPFVVFRSGYERPAVTSLKRAGFEDWRGVPVTLLQKIARELYTDYFLTGSYSTGENGYSVRMALHDTHTGSLVAERTLENTDLSALVDAMSLSLKRDLDVPEGHIETTRDLPIADILTKSESALETYITGHSQFLLNNDINAAGIAAEAAVAEDPTFAMAWLTLYLSHRFNNRPEEANAALDQVMTHLYKLTERQQYMVKSIYYDQKEDPDRQLAVLEMLVELYPDDRDARLILATVYAHRNETEKSIEQVQAALDFDPYNFEFVGHLVDLLVAGARFDEAFEALEAYSAVHPDNPAALVKTGEVHETRGDLEAAHRSYDRALILEPTNAEMLSRIGGIELKSGKFGEAKRHFEEGLRVAKTPEGRFAIYDNLVDYYDLRGQRARGLETIELLWKEADQYMLPVQAQFVRLASLNNYAEAGRADRAFALRDSISALIAPPLDKLASVGDMGIYVALEQPVEAAAAVARLEEAVNALQLHMFDAMLWRGKGRIAVFEGDYETAIANFGKESELDPSDTRVHREIGKCQRLLGRTSEARESIGKRLATHPMDPEAHYELAQVYAESGDMSKALEHLRIALEVWQDADPDYKPALEARRKLEEWRTATSM
jgi:tetratricopeptide (TPR) repeat protein/predicted Ser/Thr protein kinase